MKLNRLTLNFLLFTLFSVSCFAGIPSLALLQLPPGFKIEVYAYPVDDARSMTLGAHNIVYVGSRSAGNVYAIVPNSTDSSRRIITIASGLNSPNGVAYYQGALYVALNDKIIRFDKIDTQLQNPLPPVLIKELPQKKHHGWRYIKFGPDDKLYISIGAPCNVCLSEDPIFATIMRMNPDGSNFEMYAKGIRNSVGFDWDPNTQQLWFTDNGRDWLGNDLPPDEINQVLIPKSDFGFPYCHGKNIVDPSYGNLQSCSKSIPPVYELPAHVAALGMVFYQGKMFPPDYYHNVFIAEHGSWNRLTKVGYQVIALKLNLNKHTIEATPFVTGWLQKNDVLGRPVDLLVLPDGSLLISDDYANVIYRVSS